MEAVEKLNEILNKNSAVSPFFIYLCILHITDVLQISDYVISHTPHDKSKRASLEDLLESEH